MAECPFDFIRNRPLIESRAEHFLEVLNTGTVSTNIFLRRLHNFALDMNWLLAPIIPRRKWPVIRFGQKRAITFEEHQKIVAGESNGELRDYYELLWQLGGSQSDMATLCAENVDWANRTITYSRMKTGTPVVIRFGDAVERIVKPLIPESHDWRSLVQSATGEFCTARYGLATLQRQRRHRPSRVGMTARAGITPTMLPRNSRTSSASSICRAMSGNGARTRLRKTSNGFPTMAARSLVKRTSVFFAAGVFITGRCTARSLSGMRSGTSFTMAASDFGSLFLQCRQDS